MQTPEASGGFTKLELQHKLDDMTRTIRDYKQGQTFSKKGKRVSISRKVEEIQKKDESLDGLLGKYCEETNEGEEDERYT